MQHARYADAARHAKCQNSLFAIAASLALHAAILFSLDSDKPGQVRVQQKLLGVRLIAEAKPVSAEMPSVDSGNPRDRDHTAPTKIPGKRQVGKSGQVEKIEKSEVQSDRDTSSGKTATHDSAMPDPEKAVAHRTVIDPDSIQRVARQIAHEARGSGEIQSQPVERVEEKKSPLVREVEKADRGDCRTAYAGLGLLAVPFLVRDSVSESGCHWR